MKLPNKVTTYKESIISKMPLILKKLKIKDYTVIDLYHEVRDKVSIKDFEDTLLALYYLGKIKMVGDVLYYAERNLLWQIHKQQSSS